MSFQGISFCNISKEFNGKFALSKIDLQIKKGTVHAIVGENGAGKSTLMNLLTGIHLPSSGYMMLDEQRMNIAKPTDAAQYGIGMVHQHFMLIDVLSVWQNISLGVETCKAGRLLDQKEILHQIQTVCEQYHFSFNLNDTVGNLPVGEQQRIEILKVLFRKAEYIILDEPTAVLTQEEVENLFESIQQFRQMGKTIIFISHKIEEVLQISDQITVLRKGQLIGTLSRAQATADKLVDMMVGREVDLTGQPLQSEKGDTVFAMEHVSTKKEGFGCNLKDVSFSIRAGEIIGFAGVDGNGQSELVQCMMRLCRATSGAIRFCDQDVTKAGVKQVRELGMSCIPPDRQSQGLVLHSSLYRNMALGMEDKKLFRRGCLLSPKKIVQKTQELIQKYDIRCQNPQQEAGGLSGGNQQKIILARECGLAVPRLVVAANPTRGLDIGAIEYVYKNLEALKKQGVAVLLISTELPEILRLSDRIAVLYDGKIMGVLENKEIDLKQLGHMMLGSVQEGGMGIAGL